MQMTVLPAPRNLQHDMQLIEHEIARQVQPTPDRRRGVHQIHPHPQTPRTLRHSPHLGRWLVEHPREYVPASATPTLSPGTPLLLLLLRFRCGTPPPDQPPQSLATSGLTDPSSYTLNREEPSSARDIGRAGRYRE
ncbi:hypothetical protein MSAR_10600 [Mycolicibacterium sarraceniae]|uniref:Uncharacterized protein n=1 Tax=Mycolicibacterium sarraceniae TaxID=1534348 RepID=A0A7I7SLQ3_9MYCO|nr:hypothetical protein MSAR_10600 [Mycolicibacterium sarraceniae]